MNNRDKYIKASSIVEPSADFASKVLKEADRMNPEERREYRHVRLRRRSLISIAAACALVFALSAAAYASDLGGFKETIDTWLYGKAVNVEIEVNDGIYHIKYPDGGERSGGGVAMDDGEERPLTEEEILEELNNEIVVEDNDEGRIMLYYRDHAVDITEKMDANNIVKLKFKDGVLPTYITLKWNGDDGYDYVFGTFGYKEIGRDE